jgi:hypothetical protein
MAAVFHFFLGLPLIAIMFILPPKTWIVKIPRIPGRNNNTTIRRNPVQVAVDADE